MCVGIDSGTIMKKFVVIGEYARYSLESRQTEFFLYEGSPLDACVDLLELACVCRLASEHCTVSFESHWAFSLCVCVCVCVCVHART